jgi:hypothetical protein
VIALASDCILLRQPNGEAVPASGASIAVEVITDGETPFDEAFVKEASAAVLHYFKEVEGRESVTLDEFAQSLEKVLKGFQAGAAAGLEFVAEADLQALASEPGAAFELTFFPRLRDELRTQLQQSPRVLRFRGLRPCVKLLTGARRWNARCQSLQDQIVNFLRECLSAEPHPATCSLVVE